MIGVFVLVDMREVAESVSSVAAALPTESVARLPGGPRPRDGAAVSSTQASTQLSVDALVNHWTADDPRWALAARGGVNPPHSSTTPRRSP